MDIFEVTFIEPAEGETITQLMTESEIVKMHEASDCCILSIEPSKGTQERIDAEIEAYKNGDENAFNDAYHERY